MLGFNLNDLLYWTIWWGSLGGNLLLMLCLYNGLKSHSTTRCQKFVLVDTYALGATKEGITVGLSERRGDATIRGRCWDHPSVLGHGVVESLRVADGAGGGKVWVLGVAWLKEWTKDNNKNSKLNHFVTMTRNYFLSLHIKQAIRLLKKWQNVSKEKYTKKLYNKILKSCHFCGSRSAIMYYYWWMNTIF